MAIAARVWQVWRECESAFRKPSIALLLTANASPETTLETLADAVAEVMRPRLAQADAAGPGEEEFRTGSNSFARVPHGVVLRIDEGPDDFESLLREIAAALRVRGIDGDFDLYEPEGVPEVPELVDLFECHLRVEGERAPMLSGRPFWKAHPEALAAAVQAGLVWCRDNGSELALSLEVGLLPPATLSAAEVAPYLLEGIEAMRLDGGVVQLTSAAPDRFRTLAVEPRSGRVALIEGGAAVKDDWQLTVRRLTEEMRGLARLTVYGFLKRGSRLKDAILGISLPSDWLDVPHMNALLSSRRAVEDRLVPDAFGVQLLSAGHGENVPNGQDWRIERLGSGRVLVEHVDPAAWFDGSLVSFGGHPNPYYQPFPHPPEFLTRARADFDAILYKDGQPPAYTDVLGDRRFLQP